jgi:hypothetical protein
MFWYYRLGVKTLRIRMDEPKRETTGTIPNGTIGTATARIARLAFPGLPMLRLAALRRRFRHNVRPQSGSAP